MDDNSSRQKGYRSANDSGIPVPSRILLLDFLSISAGPCGFAQITDHFLLSTKEAKEALKSRLDRMCNQGVVIQDRRQRYALPKKLDLVAGRVSGHANGFGFVIPDQGGEDLYLHPRQMRKVLHGDHVLAKVSRIDSRGRKEGVIVEVVVDPDKEIVGHYHEQSGVGFVEPDDPRYGRDIAIATKHKGGARIGHIVVVRVIKHPIESRHVVGQIIEVIGEQMASGMETEIAIRKHSLPHHWPQQVSQQLKKMGTKLSQVKPHSMRRDIRHLPLVTIDGADARDFDDAVYCEKKGRQWRLLVAIADVSHYVKPNSALDLVALERGNSVYFPNRVIPMLPEALSNGICSLIAQQNRYCVVCDMTLNQKGKVIDYEFYRALMRSHARLTYQQVAAMLVDNDKHLLPPLENLLSLYKLMNRQREHRGTINFEFAEPMFAFDDSQRIKKITVRERNLAHKLIEECMLVANVCAAKFLQSNSKIGAIYRNHYPPEADALFDVRRFVGRFGFILGGDEQVQSRDYAKVIEAVGERKDVAQIIQMVLLRSLSQAVYGSEQAGHFALSYPIYTHFTSPIRRYSDLIVHRLITACLDAKDRPQKSQAQFGPTNKSLQAIADHCSMTERRADDATRDVVQWLKAEFMLDKVNQSFHGHISAVKEFGLFVQLDHFFIDGLVHITQLGSDYFHFDPILYRLEGERSGVCFSLGDRIHVQVIRVDLEAGKIDFALVENKADQKNRPKRQVKKLNKKKKQKKTKGKMQNKANLGEKTSSQRSRLSK